MLEDSKIIELFFARVEQAIVELSAKYGTVCRRIARNILKNDLDAEERSPAQGHFLIYRKFR